MNKQRKWLDNFGKADNANESNVSVPEDFVGLSYDTSGRNYSPAWKGQFQQGGSLPGSVGFTYARIAGAAPSEGKYAKKTMPSAQNGQEMKFYQEGLDWKPKSMQKGGTQQIDTRDPEYANAYNQRKLGRWIDENNFDSLVPLDEVVVFGKDERVKEAMSQTGSKFWSTALDLMSEPQRKMMEGITGTYQYPSEAWGFQNPGGWLDSLSSFGMNLTNTVMDSAIDPFAISGTVGVLQKPVREAASLAIREGLRDGVVPIGYGLARVFDIPENIKRVRKLGIQKKIPSDIKQKMASTPGLEKRYFETIKTRKAPWDTYLGLTKGGDNMRFTGQDPVTGFDKYELLNNINPLNPEEARHLANQLKYNVNRLNNSNSKKTIVENDKIFDIMGGYSQFLSPDQKSLMYRDVWDLQPFKSKEKLPEFIRNFEISSVIPDAKPFVSEGKLADIKIKYPKADSYTNTRQRFNDVKDYITGIYDASDMFDGIDNVTPEMINDYNKFISNEAKKIMLEDLKKNLPFLNKSSKTFQKYADISPYIKVKKQKYGGIVKDNQGYWNPDNWGKPVEIDSNYITMQGVDQPLIGISNTGDVQYMKPGMDYEFDGDKVLEIPVARLGINELDAQPMKKLNQLLNFTNNPDKTNWLDKYQ